MNAELDAVRSGGAIFKAVRGEYGAGKTFFARWLADTARKKGFATAEVQVN
jgi:tRNA A37 threonylcarbamoyladenosine biosynthesis protein TsaE